jgi:hypothetical protein
MKHCLQHNLDLEDGVVVTLYHHPDDSEAPTPEQSRKSQGKIEDGRNGQDTIQRQKHDGSRREI